MLQNDIVKTFKELGWKIGKDEVGDNFAEIGLDDRVIGIIPRLRSRTDGKKLMLDESISTEEFSLAVAIISDRKKVYRPLVSKWGDDYRKPKFTPQDISEISSSVIEWAKSVDVAQEMTRLRTVSTDSPGTLPLHHLAALALAGDIEVLRSYQSSFEAGDRLGFVNYIIKDYIDRAVALAEEYMARSCPPHSAASPFP